MHRYLVAALLAVSTCLGSSHSWAHSDASSFSESGEDHHDAHEHHDNKTLYPAVVIVDPRQVTNVVLKVNARITRVLAGAVGRQVSRGEVLAEFDSAELSTLQRTYIETFVNRAAMMAISTTGEEKLIEGRMSLAWRGLSENEIDWIENNRRPIEKVEIISPVDGYLVSVDAAVSRIVSAGSRNNLFSSSGATLFQVAARDSLIVEAAVPAATIDHLQPGDMVDLRIAGSGGTEGLTGSVEQITPTINLNNRTQTVRIKPSGEAAIRALRPGMTVHIAVDGEKGDDHHD
ncbi:HlyD family efflux transporter periplasmic adaptor subunit [Pseudaminobacter arsenicus]|uniref:HlyD family efflux transporter periplasmic adaptor subunit n=1 Tax=Borborobacter arsenicus TaxID=1851146 RepID=A0A432UZN7_9HYPH|nr:efflux RND transporter periplasmic adaptor subunit [Pseudaminobacter arsenicus]RUM95407.1 HlyD family efflux transporter periplasmic adaptor subunit [Pseudaminobacter arsenicus]